MDMKKIITLIIVLIFSISVLSAQYVKQLSKPLELQAGYDTVAFIKVDEISAQSQAYLQGMPFNIEESYVAYGATENGRQIANWSMISNTNIKLRITAEPMHHVSAYSLYLPYTLYFTYEIGYTDSAGNSQTSGSRHFSITTSGSPTSEDNPTVNITEISPMEGLSINSSSSDQNTEYYYVGSLNGGIYFQFTEWSTERIADPANKGINSQNLPSGNYQAIVTIEMVEV